MTTTNLQDNLNWLLIRASMITKQRLMKLAEAHHLTLMQAFALCLLEPDMPAPMSMVSDLLACDPSSVTGIVERLSVESYIERRESPADRRVKTITLTATGVALRSKLLAEITQQETASLGILSQAEAATLKSLLSKTLPPQRLLSKQ